MEKQDDHQSRNNQPTNDLNLSFSGLSLNPSGSQTSANTSVPPLSSSPSSSADRAISLESTDATILGPIDESGESSSSFFSFHQSIESSKTPYFPLLERGESSNSTCPTNFAPTSSAAHNSFLPESLYGKLVHLIELFKQKPASLCDYACKDQEGAERLINTVANTNSHVLLGKFLDTLSVILVDLACNSKGRRVILHCFKSLQPYQIWALSEEMVLNFLVLATDRLGCILLNDCIPLMEPYYKELALSAICNHARLLARNRYGTYVVQNVVSAEVYPFTPTIVKEITPLFLILSTQKEGSHLVEKCINSRVTRDLAVEALLKLEPAELLQVACNEFGNFVIQKALTSPKDSMLLLHLHLLLRSALLPLLKDLKGNKYGRNVASKL